jgi:hypothetical protein
VTKSLRRHIARERLELGWRESVGLPGLGINNLRAKIDTGARTSALHAVDLQVQEQDGERWIDFHVPHPGTPRSTRCKARLVDERPIKNTSGVPEIRYVVETILVLGKRHWRIEVSLADREKMEFDLILGRTAIRNRQLLVNPGRSFLAGPPIELASIGHSTPEDHPTRRLKRGKTQAHNVSNHGAEP